MAEGDEASSQRLQDRLHWMTEHQQSLRQVAINKRRPDLDGIEKKLKPISSAEIKEFTKLVMIGDEEALRKIGQSLLQGDEFIQLFLGIDGALQKIVGLLAGSEPQLQLLAAGCVVNLTTGGHKYCWQTAKASSSYLVSFMSSSSADLQELCAWAIGNIVADCDKCMELLSSNECFPALMIGFRSHHENVVEHSVCAMKNYLIHGIPADFKIGDLIDPLENLMKPGKSVSLLNELAHLVFHLTGNGFELALLERGFLERVLFLLHEALDNEEENLKYLTMLVRCLGNLSSTPESSAHVMSLFERHARLIQRVAHTLLQHEHQHLRKEMLWCLSNLIATAGPSVYRLMQEGGPLNVISDILKLVDCFTDTGAEALQCLVNLASHGEKMCRILLDNEAVTTMKPLLTAPIENPNRNLLIFLFLLLDHLPQHSLNAMSAAGYKEVLQNIITKTGMISKNQQSFEALKFLHKTLC